MDAAELRDEVAGSEGVEGTSTEVLEHECTTLAAQIAAVTCRFLLVVAELDRREAWGRWWGCKSMAHWLAWRCSLSERAAYEHLRVARALRDLPLTTAAFGRGELSYSKVRAVVRVATPEGEAELVELARTATAAQLEAIIRHTVAAQADPARRAELRELTMGWDHHGMGTMRARLEGDEHAVVSAAIEDALGRLPAPEPAGDECRDCSAEQSIRQRRAAALVHICRAWLAGSDNREGAAEAEDSSASVGAEAVIHVDLDRSGVTRVETDAGLPLHPETGLRLACDARAQAILGDDGVPLGAGRRTRTIPRRLRHAMRRHTGGRCEWVGCNQRRFTQIHHIVHWAHGGPTEWENLAELCWHHHHLVHEGGWTVKRSPDSGPLRCYRPDGTELPATAPRSTPPPPPSTTPADPDTIVPRWAGEPFDLADCVDAALHATSEMPPVPMP